MYKRQAKIITNPDEIYLGDKKFENKPVIIFVKTINGKTTAVTYVSAKHHDLTLQTMYSGKNKESLATTPSENKSLSQTSETLSGTASYKILAHEDNKVNIKENDNVSDIKYATDDTINDWLDDERTPQGIDYEKAVEKNPVIAVAKIYKSAAQTAKSGLAQGKNVKLDEKEYLRIAGSIMQTYGIKGKYNPNYKKELASQLKNFVDSIGKKDANFTDLFEELVNDCKGGILLSGGFDKTLMREEREFVLDLIHDKTLFIRPRDIQQIEEDYGSVANYRKKMFGKTYVAVKNKESGKGYYIEDVITHIEENYPYLLNENADGDMGYLWLENLVNNVLKPKYKNPYFDGENSFYETPETAAVQMAFDCTTEIINQQTSRFKADKNMLIGMIIVVTFRSDGFGKQIHPVGTAAQGNFTKRR